MKRFFIITLSIAFGEEEIDGRRCYVVEADQAIAEFPRWKPVPDCKPQVCFFRGAVETFISTNEHELAPRRFHIKVQSHGNTQHYRISGIN